jgi:predicted nucleotidyltransferase
VPVTRFDSRQWIDRLPDGVQDQAAVLARLLAAVEGDQRISAFSVTGSFARGQADELSDLDTRVWISDDRDKYLRRGEVWRAFIQLQEVRNLILRRHAAVAGLPEPQLGLISIANHHGTLPPRLEETVAELDPADIRRAALVCAEELRRHEQRPFADYVLRRLEA